MDRPRLRLTNPDAPDLQGTLTQITPQDRAGTNPTLERLEAMFSGSDLPQLGPLGAMLPALTRALRRIPEEELKQGLRSLAHAFNAVAGDELA